ncbi:MAG: preprotein translocase subunit YajC [Planctomycetaceae bacterium]|nr:preprotein translocase subunit YajC [Planctomycetaceae bacterium]
MIDWTTAVVLAQGEPAAQQPEQPGIAGLLFPMFAIAVLWYFLLLRPQRRQQAQHDSLLESLKKNDRVVTIGGIIGTISSIHADSKEVTLKVDDTTRIRMLRSAIKQVLNGDGPSESSSGSGG